MQNGHIYSGKKEIHIYQRLEEGKNGKWLIMGTVSFGEWWKGSGISGDGCPNLWIYKTHCLIHSSEVRAPVLVEFRI